MGAATIKFKGGPAMVRKLNQLAGIAEDRVLQGMRLEAEFIMTEAKKIVPVDLGPLKASGLVEPVTRRGKDLAVRMVFGGPAAPYALKQHENLSFRHTDGQQAKYLEQPLNNAIPGMANRIARAMRI